MSFIDAGTLRELRKMTESAMPDSFTPDVFGPRVSDGYGGGYSPAEPGAPIPCRKMVSGANPEAERFLAGQIQLAGLAVLVVPIRSPVNERTVGTYAHHSTGEIVRYAVTAVRTATYSPHLMLVVAPADTQGGG